LELQALPQRQGRSLAFMLFDLDGFGMINGALGHETGDRILLGVAERLRTSLESTAFIGRTGADEFAIVASVEDAAQAISLSNRIGASIAAPYMVDGKDVTLSACAGITMAPIDGTEVELLIDNAQLALDRARAEGRDQRYFFDPGMDAKAKLRQILELDLQKAVLANEFENFYQPQFDLGSDSICGAEALVRWRHPFRGLISPADFIPLAEETGYIIELGARVLHEACREAASWPNALKIAVNVSTVQLGSRNFIETVAAALLHSQLAPDRLELEITETVSLGDDSATVEILHQLRRMGVRISLDDFGTGYSSLNYLRAFPFEKIKIDKSFVDEIGCNQNTMVIVKALVDLSNGLQASTNAEGVETEAQLGWLKSIGCTEIQGYLIAPPLPAKDFRALVTSSHQRMFKNFHLKLKSA
jgi:diguanylate cyclase (GGDEF)-like protein